MADEIHTPTSAARHPVCPSCGGPNIRSFKDDRFCSRCELADAYKRVLDGFARMADARRAEGHSLALRPIDAILADYDDEGRFLADPR